MQKFHKGDWVRINKDLGPYKSHFQCDCEAIVVASYAEQFGFGHNSSFTVHIKGSGEVSWYEDHELTLIESGRLDKLQEWQKEQKTERDQKSDLDWIFSNGDDVFENTHGASIQSLANCFGLDNLWGSQGEGIIYYMNARYTMQQAKPFLKSGDKAGWLARCEVIKKAVKT